MYRDGGSRAAKGNDQDRTWFWSACMLGVLQAALAKGWLFTVLLSWARPFWCSGGVCRDEAPLGAEVLGGLHLPLGSLELVSHPAVGSQ